MESPTTVAFVAPSRLREAFEVLLESAPHLILLAYASNIEALEAAVDTEIPDTVFLYVSRCDEAPKAGQIHCQQVSTVLDLWPQTHVITLVEDPNQEAEMINLGVAAVLLEGVAPEKLLESLAPPVSGESANEAG